MDHRAEQQMEVEALSAIYPDSITVHDDISFSLVIAPELLYDGREDELPSLSLWVKYSESYPETRPFLDYEQVENVSDEQMDELKALVDVTLDEGLGMASIFNVASVIRDQLESFASQAIETRKKREEEARLLAEEVCCIPFEFLLCVCVCV
jgi:hypothetical protein